MSGDLLTHDEIAALVAAAKDGGLPDPQDDLRARRPRRIRQIDFSRPSKFTQDQQRRLERAHESFSRRASTRLSAELHTSLELALINVAQLTWSAALAEIPQGALLNVIQIDQLGTKLLLTSELDFALRLIDLVLGGSADGKVVRRDLTDIEQALSRRLFQVIVEPLSLAWQELADLSLTSLDVDSQAPSAQLATLSEPSLAFTFEARVAGSSSTLSLIVPYRSIEPVVTHLGAHRYETDPSALTTVDTAHAMAGALGSVGVEVRAEVAAVELTLAELLALEPGAAVPLAHDGGVTLLLEDTPIHRVTLGQSGGRRAVQIVEPLGEVA